MEQPDRKRSKVDDDDGQKKEGDEPNHPESDKENDDDEHSEEECIPDADPDEVLADICDNLKEQSLAFKDVQELMNQLTNAVNSMPVRAKVIS